MLEKKEKYCTELRNTITTFNYNNNTIFYKMKIQEAILKVVLEDAEE